MIYPSIYLIGFDLLFWVAIFITFFPALRKPYKVTIENRKVGLFFIVLYFLFSFWGDWFHYNKGIVLMHNGGGYGYEDIYNWLIYNICFHYLIFRIIVWGGAFLLLYETVKKFNLNLDLFLLFLGCGWMSLFAYARVTLAMSIIFYGFAVIYASKKHVFFKTILGFTIICCAFFFHKSAAFGIAMVLGGIIISKLNNKIIIIMLILSPLLIVILRKYLVLFLLSGSDDFDSSLQMSVTAGQKYLQKTSEDSGWGAILRSIFENTTYYLMAFLCVLTLFEKRAENMKNSMKSLSLINLLTILSASMFTLVDLGLNTSVLFVRFIRFAIIPMMLLMCYFYQIGFHRKIVKIVFISACCMTVYATLYTMYLTYLGVDLVNM